MIAERFLISLLAMRVDAHPTDYGEAVLDADPPFVGVIDVRIDQLDPLELVDTLRDELAVAEARPCVCCIGPQCATTAVCGVTTETFDHAIAKVFA